MSNSQFTQGLREIETDRVRGASELARRCLAILANSALFSPVKNRRALSALLTEQAQCLAAIRPSMAPIQNLLQCWQETLATMTTDDLSAARRFAADSARALSTASQRAVTEIAKHAAALLGPGKTLMTHSLSSTLVEICFILKDRNLRMIITESRPLCEGRRLAEKLSAWDIPTTYITDAQIGLFVGQADAVLVGADSVLADGAVINKAGTYLLALAAQDQKAPFYVCCESFKFRGGDGPAPELEEMAKTELEIPDWPQVTPRNIYFDITPARLVSGWITEKGIQYYRLSG